MILYGSSLSPFVRKVLAFAGEKGLDIELKPTGDAPGQHGPEFLAASPLRKMPALVDGDFTLPIRAPSCSIWRRFIRSRT